MGTAMSGCLAILCIEVQSGCNDKVIPLLFGLSNVQVGTLHCFAVEHLSSWSHFCLSRHVLPHSVRMWHNSILRLEIPLSAVLRAR